MVLDSDEAGFWAGEKFRSCEDAWFWACRAIQARRDGAERRGYGVRRPCDPEDVLLCVERLLQTGALGPDHARTMSLWGRRQVAPSARLANRHDESLWREAMAALGVALMGKGAVAGGRTRN